VSVLAWPGYAENGSNDRRQLSAVEQRTGCKVSVKTFGTSDEG